jgi:hypothetical protein
MQQHQITSASDYLAWGLTTVDGGLLTGSAIQSARYANSWSAINSSFVIPIRVYDASSTWPMRHTWEDPLPAGQVNTTPATGGQAMRTSTLIFNQFNQLYGLCEATAFPNNALNSNPTFTSGVPPWTVVGGTLTQSSAHTQGGYAFSGLITPSGSNASVFAKSEMIPASAGTAQYYGGVQWYIVSGWFFMPVSYSQITLNLAWHDAQGNLISTSTNTTAITASTWTLYYNVFKAPAGTAAMQIEPTLNGTPSSASLLYLSDVTVIMSPETVGGFPQVSQINYGGPLSYPGTSVTQLN